MWSWSGSLPRWFLLLALRLVYGRYSCIETLLRYHLGWCGLTVDHCRSPDCQLDYSNGCDANKTPQGRPTADIPRPHVGNVPYGRRAVYSCTVPKTLALTFDDGPYRYTSDLLNLLDSSDAKATFFVTGINSGKGQIDDFSMPWGKLIQRMHWTGHQLGSHSWSHQDLSKVKPSVRRDQLLKNEAALRNIMGGIPTYMRPPYSSCTMESGCLDDMEKLGYHIIYFDMDTNDYNNDSPDLIQRSKDAFDQAMTRRDRPDRPFLAISHDVHEQTVYNLTAYLLERARQEGYRAVTVGECLGDPRDNWYRWDHSAVPFNAGNQSVNVTLTAPESGVST
ncbi:chitin deacetylase, putative [Paecilomyces variotii No. 5]|uniref:Chitin deacetylase, putative n=1 Tax=Byssochlamys spectabilis (strain No. 5 / NBRC 109023) TaxID=1356009 RepID=V5I555_BYSSN|nr:chitin deacetylase, putative [Paecilomyces variotii No. 5]